MVSPSPDQTRGVLDTSTVILLPRLAVPALLPDEPLVSAITLAELSVGPLVARTDQERAARQAHLQQAETDFDPLPFDIARIQRSAEIMVLSTELPAEPECDPDSPHSSCDTLLQSR